MLCVSETNLSSCPKSVGKQWQGYVNSSYSLDQNSFVWRLVEWFTFSSHLLKSWYPFLSIGSLCCREFCTKLLYGYNLIKCTKVYRFKIYTMSYTSLESSLNSWSKLYWRLPLICFQSSGTLENSGMKVHRCHNSYIYLLSPLR